MTLSFASIQGAGDVNGTAAAAWTGLALVRAMKPPMATISIAV
jgi:hypothetical protein